MKRFMIANLTFEDIINVNQSVNFLKPNKIDPWIDLPFPLHCFEGRKQTNKKTILEFLPKTFLFSLKRNRLVNLSIFV